MEFFESLRLKRPMANRGTGGWLSMADEESGQSSSSVSRREGANTGGKELDKRVSRVRLTFEKARSARQRSAKFH